MRSTRLSTYSENVFWKVSTNENWCSIQHNYRNLYAKINKSKKDGIIIGHIVTYSVANNIHFLVSQFIFVFAVPWVILFWSKSNNDKTIAP